MIVDFHTHTFPPRIAGRAIAGMEAASRMKARLDGTPEALLRSMSVSGVDLSVSLPVATYPEQPHKLNLAAVEANAAGSRILYFAAAHPRDSHWREELRFAARQGFLGIKLHPMYQETDFDDPLTLRLLSEAAELGLIVVVHAGEDVGIPGPARCTPEMALRAQRETGITRLVLAHLGGWRLWDRVLGELVGAPIYLDTSFCLGRMQAHPSYPRPTGEDAMGDPALCRRILSEHPAEYLLFGTDSPWGEAREEIDALRGMHLGEERLRAILGENALGLLYGPSPS